MLPPPLLVGKFVVVVTLVEGVEGFFLALFRSDEGWQGWLC